MKNTGPLESSLIAIATSAKRGAEIVKNTDATARSINRFASVRQLNGGALRKETMGTPSKSNGCKLASFCGKKSDKRCVVIPCSSNNATADSIWVYCDFIGKAIATSSITSLAKIRG